MIPWSAVLCIAQPSLDRKECLVYWLIVVIRYVSTIWPADLARVMMILAGC